MKNKKKIGISVLLIAVTVSLIIGFTKLANAEDIQVVYTPPQRYNFTHQEIKLLAQLLSGDARKDGDGEYDIDYQKNINYKEVYKVLDVVMNRVRDPRFPNNVTDVVLARRQFVVFPRNTNTIPSEKTLKVVNDFVNKYNAWDTSIQVCPENHVYFSAGRDGSNITRSK